MKKALFVIFFAINLGFVVYGVSLTKQADALSSKISSSKAPYEPSEEAWKMFSDPKHFPFLKEHIQRLNGDVASLKNGMSSLARNTGTLALVIVAIGSLNLLVGAVMRKAF